MKMTKKKVFVTALAICLVAILSMGSLAWFNASDTITNKFKIADSDGRLVFLPNANIFLAALIAAAGILVALIPVIKSLKKH